MSIGVFLSLSQSVYVYVNTQSTDRLVKWEIKWPSASLLGLLAIWQDCISYSWMSCNCKWLVCVSQKGCVCVSGVFVKNKRSVALAVDSLGNCCRTCRGWSQILATETQSGSQNHYYASWSHGDQTVWETECILIVLQAYGGRGGQELKYVSERRYLCYYSI